MKQEKKPLLLETELRSRELALFAHLLLLVLSMRIFNESAFAYWGPEIAIDFVTQNWTIIEYIIPASIMSDTETFEKLGFLFMLLSSPVFIVSADSLKDFVMDDIIYPNK